MWCNDLWNKFSGKIIYLYRYKRFFPYLTLDSGGIERGNNGGSIFFTQKYADKWPTLFRKKKGKTVISPFGGKLVLRKFQFYLNRTQGV